MPTKHQAIKVLLARNERAALEKAATKRTLSLSNYVRSLLGLPPFPAGGARPNTGPKKERTT